MALIGVVMKTRCQMSVATIILAKLQSTCVLLIGELAEWLMAFVLKTKGLVRGPGVRIPHSPQNLFLNDLQMFKL